MSNLFRFIADAAREVDVITAGSARSDHDERDPHFNRVNERAPHGHRRIGLPAIELFVGLTSVVSSISILTGWLPFDRTDLQGTPFATYTILALILGKVVGSSNLWAARGLAAAVAGAVIFGWIASQVYLTGLGSFL